MHPKNEDAGDLMLFADGEPVAWSAEELPEVTVEIELDDKARAILEKAWLDYIEVIVSPKKNLFCNGGRKRFEKLCRGVLGMERNEIRQMVRAVQEARRHRGPFPRGSYAEKYADLLHQKLCGGWERTVGT